MVQESVIAGLRKYGFELGGRPWARRRPAISAAINFSSLLTSTLSVHIPKYLPNSS